ncbi:tetratricopeptide repeat protein [Alkalispirochaeta sphaeroplastigenens]|nr:tetratricopeptide repeat protein [Alkalispirochaeta sphaeroplastigenens]
MDTKNPDFGKNPGMEPGSNQDQERLAHLSQQGYQYLRENMTREARARFEEVLVAEPQNNYALVGMGDLCRKERRFKEAVAHYQRCLTHHPENNYALFGLAESYRSMKQFNRATEVWERYLKHDNENVTVLTRVADAYRKTRSFDRSRELYLRVLELEPDNSYALIGLGHLHYDFSDYEKALGFWERMYQKSGDAVDIRVLTSLGNCHRKMKTFESGVLYFEKALDREPHNFFALYGLADCFRGMHRHDKSLIYWKRILEMDPENKVILTRVGDAYRTQDDLDQAEQFYRQALNVQYDSYAVLGLAIIHRKRKEYAEAIRGLEQLLESEPEGHRAVLELAACYEEQGKIPEALAVLSRFVQRTHSTSRSVQTRITELKNRL